MSCAAGENPTANACAPLTRIRTPQTFNLCCQTAVVTGNLFRLAATLPATSLPYWVIKQKPLFQPQARESQNKNISWNYYLQDISIIDKFEQVVTELHFQKLAFYTWRNVCLSWFTLQPMLNDEYSLFNIVWFKIFDFCLKYILNLVYCHNNTYSHGIPQTTTCPYHARVSAEQWMEPSHLQGGPMQGKQAPGLAWTDLSMIDGGQCTAEWSPQIPLSRATHTLKRSAGWWWGSSICTPKFLPV